MAPTTARSQSSASHSKHIFGWAFLLILVLLVAASIGIWIVRKRAEPLLRARVIQSLSDRFDSRVELGDFHVYILDGLQVEGSAVKLYPRNLASETPLIAIRSFSFRTTWTKLFRTPMRIERAQVKGLEINLPPKSQRKQIPSLRSSGKKLPISLNEIDVEGALLTLGTDKPGKVPLDFAISHLVLNTVGDGEPMRFRVTLVNPKPVGDISSTGYFGPFDAGSPGDSHVQGDYDFSHADLSTIKGIGGMLSSKGQYSGTLNHIVVDGYTDTPDFQVTISGHPVPLHTQFHAIVDGTNGDTYLQPVDATFLHSHILARGEVVRAPDRKGHNISLGVVVDRARIEDLLMLGVRTSPPVMTGDARLRTSLMLPAGEIPVSQKLQLKGHFLVTGARFSHAETQKKIDSISMRAQGKPMEETDVLPDNILSQMQGDFALRDSKLTLTGLQYTVPGLAVNMDGVYSLDGNEFDFHGKARMDAHLSEMTTGWKSILLKPVDPFFAKHGAGTEVPIKVTGTRSEPKFGLDFGHKDASDPSNSGRKDHSKSNAPPK
jgi:hypothetical protein